MENKTEDFFETFTKLVQEISRVNLSTYNAIIDIKKDIKELKKITKKETK